MSGKRAKNSKTRLTLGVLSSSEIGLFIISHSEDVHPRDLNTDDQRCRHGTQLDGVRSQESCLETVRKRNPGEVAKGEHKAETVGCNVHLVEDCVFLHKTVEDVPALKDEDDPHTISQFPNPDILLASARNVE